MYTNCQQKLKTVSHKQYFYCCVFSLENQTFIWLVLKRFFLFMYYSSDRHSSTYWLTIIRRNGVGIIWLSERGPIIPNYKPYQKRDSTFELSNWTSCTQTELFSPLCRLRISGSNPLISTAFKLILFHILSQGILWWNYSLITNFFLEHVSFKHCCKGMGQKKNKLL